MVNKLSRKVLEREVMKELPNVVRRESYDPNATGVYFEEDFHKFAQDGISQLLRHGQVPDWTITPSGPGRISVGGTIVLHAASATTDQVRSILENVINDSDLKEERRGLLGLYTEAEEAVKEFGDLLDRELQKVELGEDLKGKCELGF